MFISNGDGTYTSGAWNVILIYYKVGGGTFHPTVYVEAPMPGSASHEELDMVRLMSRLHHTEGFSSLEQTQEYIRTELAPKLGISECNVVLDPPCPWNGKSGDVMILPNWRKRGAERSLCDVITQAIG